MNRYRREKRKKRGFGRILRRIFFLTVIILLVMKCSGVTELPFFQNIRTELSESKLVRTVQEKLEDSELLNRIQDELEQSELIKRMKQGGLGSGLIARIRYHLRGDDLETWEQAARDEGLAAKTEEYYYQHLPENLREAYREIYVKLMRNEDSGNMMASVTVDEFWKAYYAVLSDHPEIFWIGSSAQVEESGLTGMVLSYQVEVTVPMEERALVKEKLEAEADACIGQIPEEYSDYQKIKAVYTYIVEQTDYQSDSQDSQNIQSVLLHRASVCAGYSKAFQYILNRMGFFCTYITGTIRDGGEHGWNLIRIDDAYYHVDVTWGDPVFANGADGEGNMRSINYTYLCCTDETLFVTHVPGDSVPLPVCSSDAYDYYKINGMYYETFDYWTIYEVLMDSVRSGEQRKELRFGSRESYENAKFELFEGNLLKDAGRYLMDLNGVNTWNYKYQTDEDLYTIVLYWY